MRVIHTGIALLAGVAVADYKTVNDDIKQLAEHLATLGGDVAGYLGGIAYLPDALQVQVDSVNIHKLIVQATKDAQASAPFGSQGSMTVSNSVLALEPKIKKSLASVAAKNASFSYFSPVVLATLYQLKEDTDTFSAAIIKKFTKPYQGVAPTVVKQIDGYFNKAIAAFGGKTS